jgi:microsomal dipeptidase-like Zn-dependent dipeptidase
MPLLRSAVFATASLAALLMVATGAGAQSPWSLTLRPASPSLRAGECTPVYLDLLNASGRDSPRNPAGMKVSIADFDMSVTGGAVVGRYDGPSAWSACACPASAGVSATITASYPARGLALKARVSGVAFQTSITVPVGERRGSGVPIGCEALKTATVPASGSAPWTVTLTSAQVAIPIGTCGAISIDLRDSSGKSQPRNPAGVLISLADFDMTATGSAVAGQYSGAANWSVCGCQAGTVGSLATITASYPSGGLAAAARVPGVAFRSTMTIPLAKALGSSDPPACSAAKAGTIAGQPAPNTAPATPVATQPVPIITTIAPVPVTVQPVTTQPVTTQPVAVAPGSQPIGTAPVTTKTATPTAIAPLPPGPAPIGVSVTGTQGSATLVWQPVAGVASYVVTRHNATDPALDQTLAATSTGMNVPGLRPGTAYTWTVNAIQVDGRQGSTSVQFTTPVAENPLGFMARQTGDGTVKLWWQWVSGASYYVLVGPGTSGGIKVDSNTFTHTLTGIPAGDQEWAVAAYYEPGPASTPAAEWPRAKLSVKSYLLSGWVDLHTHPMVHLAFGGKLIHGGVDIGSLLPADNACAKGVRATSMAHALSDDRPSHGGWNAFSFPCGDDLRKLLLHEFQQGNAALTTASPATGFPDFTSWPKWNDITHQKMWYEWIQRARDGGLRVMVALATNNKTLADAMSGGNAITGTADGATDDKSSANLQLAEMEAFVKRHPDFMEVAYGAADIKRIVQANKIAVVLGVEVDNLGNFLSSPVATLPAEAARLLVADEIQRLYNNGARYVFPIHVLDNAFGGTAIYEHGFNVSNLREAGHYWDIECANVVDNITHTYQLGTDLLENILKSTVSLIKLGIDPFGHPGAPPVCPDGPAKSRGHRNQRGLTPVGIMAIKEMMKRGMIIDIDHMSQQSADMTLQIAEDFGYPVVSGHTGIRGLAGSDAENSRTPAQMARISKLHGMFGLGSDGAHAYGWAGLYQSAMRNMGYLSTDPANATYENGAVSFGTDLNGLVKGPQPGGGSRVVYGPEFRMSTSGAKFWNYNTEGVAHYGMLTDFLVDVRTAPSNGYSSGGMPLGVDGKELVDHHLFRSANYFWEMWQRIEARRGAVQ